MRKIYNIAAKEVRHILRDVRSLIIAILMPVVMTFLYGYAINLDIKNIKLAVIDLDKSYESRDLSARFFNSGYFRPADETADITDPERVLKAGDASAVLTIRSGFAEAVHKGSEFQLGLLVDGADANTASAVTSYSNIILMEFLVSKMPIDFQSPGVSISQQILYNPDLKSSHFFVPGLMGVILMMISALLTSLTIAREKETGTMEQLLTCPVTSQQIIIGKVLPYIELAFLDGLLIILFAVFHFEVPFIGSILLMVLFGFIYITTALSLGILISTLVKTQQLAMMTAMLVTVLPSVMLSGFIFEIKNMPLVLQGICYIVPAKYFILIIRGILLKGSTLGVLWVEAAFLIAMCVLLLAIASKRFKLKIG